MELRTKFSQLTLIDRSMRDQVDKTDVLEREVDTLMKSALNELIEEMQTTPLKDELKGLME